MTEPTWPDLVNSLCTGVPPALPHERAAAWARWLRDPDRSHNPNAHELIAELLDTLAKQQRVDFDREFFGVPDQVQELHELLYTAQVAGAMRRDQAIARARVLLSDIRRELAAQQPANHVQNSAEIEHVTGDVSKNGADSNMTQQSAQAADSATVAACIARLEQGGQSAAVAILRHHFQ